MKTFISAGLVAAVLALDHEGRTGGAATARPMPRPVQMAPRQSMQQPRMEQPRMQGPPQMQQQRRGRPEAMRMRSEADELRRQAELFRMEQNNVRPMDDHDHHHDEPEEFNPMSLTSGDVSPPTEMQLLNIMASKGEGFINPSGRLDKTGLFDRLPRKFVGRRSMTGREFGCNWPRDFRFWGPEYELQSAECKMEQIWEATIADDRVQDWFDGIAQLPMFNQDTNETFDWLGDDMPEGRLKIVHTQGTVTKVMYESVGDHPYTGIFKGAQHGIMRISEVSRTTPDVIRTSPGFGLKWLRDGHPSANGTAMFSFAGQPSYNFLSNSWTTHLAEPQNICGRMTVSSKFAEATRHLGNTSVMEWAEVDQNGRPEQTVVWPFMLRFEPTMTTAFPDTFQADFSEQMMLIKPDIHFMDVYALDDPIGLGGEEQLVGRIWTKSLTTTSMWGDTKLFFKHGRFNDDLARRPEWFDHVEIFEDPLWRDIIPLPQRPPVEGACPFSWMFGLAM